MYLRVIKIYLTIPHVSNIFSYDTKIVDNQYFWWKIVSFQVENHANPVF